MWVPALDSSALVLNFLTLQLTQVADNPFSLGDPNQPLPGPGAGWASWANSHIVGLASRGTETFQVTTCVCVRTHMCARAHMYSCDSPECAYLCADTCEASLAPMWCGSVVWFPLYWAQPCVRAYLSGFKCSHQGMSVSMCTCHLLAPPRCTSDPTFCSPS